MGIFCSSPLFDLQVLRAISNGADIGECLAMKENLQKESFDSWYNSWYEQAERIEQSACRSKSVGNFLSAQESFFQAANYYRTAFFFLYGTPIDPRLHVAYEKHCFAFEQGLKLLNVFYERLTIPFENTFLHGYFYSIDKKERPLLILNSGYDSTHQELFMHIGHKALLRGYNVLCFDGPGQGHTLIKQNIPMRHDWGKVITAVIDHALSMRTHRHIALYGVSWGGLLTPIAAASEKRISALIVNPGEYDALLSVKVVSPSIYDALVQEDTKTLLSDIQSLLKDTQLKDKLRAKLYIHGLESVEELFIDWKKYTVQPVVHNIQCPTLVLDQENELFSKGQAKMLFEALKCPKEYFLFTHCEGGSDHSALGAPRLLCQKVFDWLSQVPGFSLL